MSAQISYAHEPGLTAAEFQDILVASSLAERRPADDLARLNRMLRNADIIMVARDAGRIVGVSRAITDFVGSVALSRFDRKFEKSPTDFARIFRFTLGDFSLTQQSRDYYRWLFFAAGCVEPAMSNHAVGWDPSTPDMQVRFGYGSYHAVIDTLAKAVSGKRYIAGDEFSAADVYVGSMSSFRLRFRRA